MTLHTRRMQTMLTDEQYEALVQLSAELDKPISVLIREAIEKVYFEQTRRERRCVALNRLISMNAPVCDWEQMEKEIIQGALR